MTPSSQISTSSLSARAHTLPRISLRLSLQARARCWSTRYSRPARPACPPLGRSSSAAKKSRDRLEDLIGPPQLPHLGPGLGQVSGLLSTHTRPRPAVHLSLPDPLAQRLGTADPQLGGHRLDRRSVRGVLRPHLGDHPDRPLTQLRRIAHPTSHDSIFLSQDGASRNPGTIHLTELAIAVLFAQMDP
jgi:hypothetical protein